MLVYDHVLPQLVGNSWDPMQGAAVQVPTSRVLFRTIGSVSDADCEHLFKVADRRNKRTPPAISALNDATLQQQ
eukprot:9143807-Pyramimonas_sp.AAC.1